MQAVMLSAFGPPDRLVFGDTPEPSLGPADVLLRVRACAVNRLDLDIRAGRTSLPLTRPAILGLEFSGIVVATGREATSVGPGSPAAVLWSITCGRCAWCRTGDDHLCDRRGLYGVDRPGGYAELVAVRAVDLLAIPAGLSFAETAALGVSFATAWHALIERAGLCAGQRVLIPSGASGLGTAAIQIAKLQGAEVIATASTPPKREALRVSGADRAVSDDQLEGEVADFTARAGVDVVLEHVGGSGAARRLALLRKAGTAVVVGGHAGERAEVGLGELFRREIRLIGASRAPRRTIAHVFRLAGEGRLRPIVHDVLPLKEAARAHELLEDRGVSGKLVLEP